MSKKLQKEKLRLEIEQLNRKWYQKADFLKVLFPTALAIFSLIYALTSGFFSTKSEVLELKRQQLQFEITEFENDKEELIVTNKTLLEKRNNLRDSISKLSRRTLDFEQKLKNELITKQNLLSEIDKLKNTKTDFTQEIAELEKDFEKKKEKYLSEIENKYYQELDLESNISSLNDTIKKLRNDVERLQYYTDMLMNSPFSRKYKHQQWGREKMIEYLDLKIKKSKITQKEYEDAAKRSMKSLDTLEVKRKLLKMN